MFQLNLDRLPGGTSSLPIDGTLSIETEGPGGAAVTADCAIRGELAVEAMDQKILVHGELAAERSMECHRCSEPTAQSYSADVDILILRTPARGGDDGFEKDDNWVIHQQRGVVDLTAALHEAMVLDEPIHVICDRAECSAGGFESGLEDGDIDPRWEKLKRLKDGGDVDD